MRSTIALSLALVVAASCGGTKEPAVATSPVAAAVPATERPTTDAGTAITFKSEPIEAGRLFGSADNGDSSAVGTSESAESCSNQGCADDGDATPTVASEPFTPEVADAPFCAKLDELAERPFPSDDLEAIVVVQVWFAELRPTLVPSIVDDFEVLSSWLDGAVASQGSLGFDDTNEAVDDASDRINDYVNTKCEGPPIG